MLVGNRVGVGLTRSTITSLLLLLKFTIIGVRLCGSELPAAWNGNPRLFSRTAIAAPRGIKNVGREPSWCRLNLEYHKALAPFFILI